MTTTVRTTAANRIPMTSLRKTALVAGAFYLITFISIPTLALYGPVKNHRDWTVWCCSHTGWLVGGLLQVIDALAGRQAADQRHRTGVCHRPRAESRPDLHRRRQPAGAGDPAARAWRSRK